MTRPHLNDAGDDGMDKLRAIAAQLRPIEEAGDALRASRNQEIRDLVAAGAVKVHVAEAAGINRERLYQILKAPKKPTR